MWLLCPFSFLYYPLISQSLSPDDAQLICCTNEVKIFWNIWVRHSFELQSGACDLLLIILSPRPAPLLWCLLIPTDYDLGVIADHEFKSSAQETEAVLKAPYILTMLNRTSSIIPPKIFLLTNTVLTHSQVEYCARAWSPNLVRLSETTEFVHLGEASSKKWPYLGF